MIKRTLYFANRCKLTTKDCQLVVDYPGQANESKRVPIEDIGIIVVENQEVIMSMPLINALAENNVATVICDRRMMPAVLIQPLEGNTTQGERYKDQMAATLPLKKNLWMQTIEAKIKNQAKLLDKTGKDGRLLKPYFENVKSGDADNREGAAARIYWKQLMGDSFQRTRLQDGVNSLLNYGYTILRAATARALVGSGLLPAFGIYHRNRYNAFPLADDIMEPYRPFVDEKVNELLLEGKTELTRETKMELLKILTMDTRMGKDVSPLQLSLRETTASLAKCFAGTQKKLQYASLL